jgi:hypothetical protein
MRFTAAKDALLAPDRMIVVADNSAAAQPFDLSWLLRYLPDHCVAVIESSDVIDGSRPWVVPNLAHEALPYLRFIIDHYDNLPRRTVFLHGHRASWHNKDMAVVLRALNWDLEYANLNVNSGLHLAPDAPVEGGGPMRYAYIKAVWPTAFQPWFGPIPPYFNVHCCGQFLVSRDAIRALPLAFWQAYYNLALRSPFAVPANLAILYEHMWGFVMTRGTWNATILEDADAELCTVLTMCPLPVVPAMEPAVWHAEQRGFYPCGAFPSSSGSSTAIEAGGGRVPPQLRLHREQSPEALLRKSGRVGGRVDDQFEAEMNSFHGASNSHGTAAAAEDEIIARRPALHAASRAATPPRRRVRHSRHSISLQG